MNTYFVYSLVELNLHKGNILDGYQTSSYCMTPTTVRLPVTIESGLSLARHYDTDHSSNLLAGCKNTRRGP
jgi:hypothetical protein